MALFRRIRFYHQALAIFCCLSFFVWRRQQNSLIHDIDYLRDISNPLNEFGYNSYYGNDGNDEDNVKDIDIRTYAIVSMQRSSSTFLAFQTLASDTFNDTFAKIVPLPKVSSSQCAVAVSLNEIFSPNQSKDAWSKEGKKLLPESLQVSWDEEQKEILKERKVFVRNLNVDDLRNFVEEASYRTCHEYFSWTYGDKDRNYEDFHFDTMCAETSDRPKPVCYLNFKQFPDHLAMDQHLGLWETLPNLNIIVLERNVTDRWRSYWHATQTGDWSVYGHDKKHILAMEKEKDIVPEVPDWFEKEHKDWYNSIRHFEREQQEQLLSSKCSTSKQHRFVFGFFHNYRIRSMNPDCKGTSSRTIPFLDLNFKNATNDPIGTRRLIYHGNV